jgi:hypothetical protein
MLACTCCLSMLYNIIYIYFTSARPGPLLCTARASAVALACLCRIPGLMALQTFRAAVLGMLEGAATCAQAAPGMEVRRWLRDFFKNF